MDGELSADIRQPVGRERPNSWAKQLFADGWVQKERMEIEPACWLTNVIWSGWVPLALLKEVQWTRNKQHYMGKGEFDI